MLHTEAERAGMLDKMQAVANAFYPAACQTGCHAFIEFCGLMNEYIKVCSNTSAEGVDFTEANDHIGVALVMKPHNVEYLAEKLRCIYGPTLQDPELQRAFLKKLLEPEHG